ncbi:MAG: TolC family protein [bacterium]
MVSSTKEETTVTRPLEITIESSILMALQNNHSLHVERVKPLVQRTFEDEERAVFDPVITGEVSRSREKIGQNDLQTSESKVDQTETSLEVAEYLPTGTKLSLGITTDRVWRSLYGDEQVTSPDQGTTRAGLSITQALLRGAGIRANLANLRQARLETFSSQYEFRGFAESIISDVEKTYWDYALAQQRINIFTESLNLAEQQMKETEERIKIGVLSEIELIAAQAEVALRKEDLINARSDLANVRLKLLRLLNPSVPDLWEEEILLLDQPAVPDIKLDDVNSHVEVALKMRPDLNQAKLQLQQSDIEIVKTKNGLLPKMDFFIILGKSGYSDSFGGSLKDLDDDSYDIRAGINLEYPLFNRSAKARHQRSVFSRDQSDVALKNLIQLVQLDVLSAYIEIKRTSEQVLATAATRKLQEEKMRAETEKFRVGKSTSLLVAQTQRDLTASRISEIESIVGYLKSLIELYRLEGSLLERRGIELF